MRRRCGTHFTYSHCRTNRAHNLRRLVNQTSFLRFKLDISSCIDLRDFYTTMHCQEQSRLLQLPVELQLAIFEYVVIEDEPLLLNCGCDSSYRGDVDAWNEDQALWDKGEKHPPFQPGLTATCTTVRAITLPMFYGRNAFRAHYCWEADFDMAVKWLKLISPVNRRLLRDLCLWDKNPFFDEWRPDNLKKATRSEVFRGLGGEMETLQGKGYCCHHVTFGKEYDDHYDLLPGLFDDFVGMAAICRVNTQSEES